MTSALRTLVTTQLEAAGVDPSNTEVEGEIERLEVAALAGANDMCISKCSKWESIYWAMGKALLEGVIEAVGTREGKIAFRGCDD